MTVLKDSMKRKRNGKWLGKQSNPVSFTMKRTDWRIFLYRSVIGVGRDHRSWMRNLQRRVLDR